MMNDIVTRIEKLEPHSTEVIVIGFNFNDYDLCHMRDILESVKNQFPNNTIIAIPDKISVESCSKDVLENIISMITAIIEEL